jgi:hypothetical protein
MPPVILWWAWLVFAVANLIDLAIARSGHTSLVTAVALVAITGVAWACAFRPRLIADASGVQILNPFRDYRVPWHVVQAVEFGGWVRIRCLPAPGKTTTKTIDSWALYAPPRSRLKAERAAYSGATGYAVRSALPDQATHFASLPPGPVIARRLDERARREREAQPRMAGQNSQAEAGQVAGRWARASLATMIIPALALVVVIAA